MTQDTRSPYPGLRSYESDESDLFFGREGCVDDMLEKLSTTRFLAVLGTSGSGKSSLVRTGLLDALELGFLPGRTSEWVVADMHPGDRPMHNLARTLVELDGVEHNDIELSLMRSFVNRGPRSLMQWCDDFGLKEDQNLLLIVDQFEELFRYRDYAGREEAEAFVALLLESARSDPRIHIVITMRSEFLGACAMMPGLAEQINTGLYLTRRMNRGECEEAIEGPSHVLGFEVEPRLVSEILNDMASLAPWDQDDALTSLEQLSRRADQLPLMQHVLNRLYERARSAGGPIVLTFEDYKVIGRLRGAIDAHAEEILSSLDEEARAAAEPVFRALVTGTNLSNAVREPRRFRELVEVAGGDAAAAARLIDAFRAQGCSFLRPPPGVPLEPEAIVDLGHESLIRQWSKLGDWLAKEARDAATWSRIVTAQSAWAQGEGDLLSGLDLANAQSWWSAAAPTEAWASGHGGNFGHVRAFLEESSNADALEKSRIADNERRRLRRLRTRASAYLVMALVSFGAAFYGWNASIDEREARQAAEAAVETADVALASAQEANTFAITASETFLIDMTERLRRSFGVRPDDVQSLLDEGTSFLDRLDTRMPGDPNLRRARAKLLLEYAGFAADQGDVEGSVAYLADARALFDGQDMTPEDALVMVELDVLASSNMRVDGQYDDSLSYARQAKELMEVHGAGMTEADRIYGTTMHLRAQGLPLGGLERYDEAEDAARSCIDVSRAALDDRRVLSERATCATIIVWARVSSNEERPPDDLVAELRTYVDALSEEERDLSDWIDWFNFVGNVAYGEFLADDYTEAMRVLEEAYERSGSLLAAAPFNGRLRERHAAVGRNLAYYYDAYGDLETALAIGLETVAALEALGTALMTNYKFAESYRDTLSNTYALVTRIEGWAQSPGTLAIAEELVGKWYRHTQVMFEAGMELCEMCRLEPATFLSQVAEYQLQAGDPGAAATLFQVYDELKEANDGLNRETATEEEVIAARRALFWAATDLPGGSTDRAAFDDPAQAIGTFEATTERLETYLAANPEAREVAFTAALAYSELAKLYDQAGRAAEAERAVRRGVELEGFDAINLLLNWAEKGDGPIAQDPELAEEMAALLAAREWTPRNVHVMLDELWTEGVEEKAGTLFVRDVPVGEGSIVDRILAEAALMGRRVSDASVARLREWEQEAEEAEVTFVQYYSRTIRNEATDDPNGAAEIEFRLRQLAEAGDAYNAAGVIYRQQSILNRNGELTEALGTLLKNRTETGYSSLMSFMIEVGALLERGRLPNEAILVFNAILENVDIFQVDEQVQILTYRAGLHGMVGNHDEALSDYMLALSLEPDNYQLLNNVGYSLTEQDNMLPIAISLLERSVSLEPEDSGSRHLAMDSLGWAYVRNGQIERGLELIKEAFVVGDDDLAEIMYHVAEAHRRLREDDKAVAAYLQAREYQGSPEVMAAIEEGLNRLGYFPDFTPEEIEHVRAIHAANGDMEPHPGIAVDPVGVALRGYDTVALYETGKLVRGDPRYWSIHDSAIWLFATRGSKETFDADPERSAPAFGGHCGYCMVSSESKVPGDPAHWTLDDGRLYLHSSQIAATHWSSSPDANAAQARSVWGRFKDIPARETAPSHVASLLGSLSVGTAISVEDAHVTFATETEVAGIRAALNALNGSSAPERISTDRSSVAIGGYDTVAYFTEGAARRGSFDHWAIWSGAIWLFESKVNRLRFENNPEEFAPLFGGYCAYCVATGSKTHGDPRYWIIIDGQLALGASSDFRESWSREHAEAYQAAKTNWVSIAETSVSEVGRPSRYVATVAAIRRAADVHSVEW